MQRHHLGSAALPRYDGGDFDADVDRDDDDVWYRSPQNSGSIRCKYIVLMAAQEARMPTLVLPSGVVSARPLMLFILHYPWSVE
jgi:hypothetical protein